MIPRRIDLNVITQSVAVAMVFALFLPTAISNIVLVFLLISYGISGSYREKWLRIRGNSVAVSSLSLFVIFVIGTIYSSSGLDEAFKFVKMYQELLLLPIMISVWDTETWRRRAYWTLFVAIGLGLIVSFSMYWGWLPTYKPGEEWVPFKGRIAWGFFLAFAVYMMVHHAVLATTPKQKWLWSIFAVFASVDLLFLISGRTGHIVFLAMLALLLFQYRNSLKKYWLLVLLAVSTIGSAVVLTSPAINSRANDIELAKTDPESSSVGLRLIYCQTSLRIIADHPLFGAGTGSFANEFLTHANEHAELKADNPHNEYLLIASQLGLVGLSAFIWLLYCQFQLAKQLPERYGLAAQGLVVAMAVGCLFNSFLRDHSEGHFYAIYGGLLFSAFSSRQKKAS